MTKTANNRTVLGGTTYPINVSDSFINCYATAAITLILPPRSSVNSLYSVGINDILNAFGTFNVTLQCSGNDTVNGASSLVLSTNGTALVIEVSGNTNYVASGLGSGSAPPSSNPLISKTYAELAAMVGGSTLVPGQAYLITDFATKHIIPNTAVENTGVTEPIIITADTTTTFYCNAISTLFPSDIIYYEFVDSTTAGGDKGRIYLRRDTINIVETGYDWRNVKFRRWQSARYSYNTLVGTFLVNEVVVGSISGASGRIIEDLGTSLQLRQISGQFQFGETITGNSSGATALLGSILPGNYDNLTDTGFDFQDVYTFGDSASALNFNDARIGEITDKGISLNGAPTDKLNNIIFGVYGSYIKMGQDCFNCTMGQNTDTITVAPLFQLNIIGNSCSNNSFGFFFINNIISSGCAGNSFGYNFSTSIIGESCLFNNIGPGSQNIIGDTFAFNTIAAGFTSNRIGNSFSGNIIATDFSSNIIGTIFQKNICGAAFSTNIFGDITTNNLFGQEFQNNVYGDGTRDNIIGSKCSDNTFTGNVFDSNIIGSSFKNNTGGAEFRKNTIGDNFGTQGANTIGTNFERNRIGSDFDRNTIGNSFISNNINDSFQSNIIGNSFVMCFTETYVSAVDFTAATIVYGNYSKTIVKDSSAVNKVIYLSGVTGLNVVNAVNA